MLPDFLIPHKHYAEETITGVLNGVVGPDDEDSETFPSETTMIRWLRWLRWFITNLQNIEGYMRSIGYRLLGFSEELLKTDNSLLDHMRSSFPDTWMKNVLRCIYNSGNKLQPFYG